MGKHGRRKLPEGDLGQDATRSCPDAALRRLQQVGDDISCLIHEVRTPLTAIITAAELLKFPCSAERHDFLVDIIDQEARRIDILFIDFFEAYHHDAGTWLSELNLTTVNIAELIDGATARFRNLDRKYDLRTSISAGLPPVRADREKLNLVLRNLLANAIKYSPNGGTIVVSANRNATMVIIGVRDEGIGIPEEDLHKIFERSFRGTQPNGCETRGAGLGLTIVKRVMERHGGQVRVESRLGEGSTFCLLLPIDAAI